MSFENIIDFKIQNTDLAFRHVPPISRMENEKIRGQKHAERSILHPKVASSDLNWLSRSRGCVADVANSLKIEFGKVATKFFLALRDPPLPRVTGQHPGAPLSKSRVSVSGR